MREPDTHQRELAAERQHIDRMYRRLDAERAAAATELARVLRDSAATGHEDRWNREVSVRTVSERQNRLRVAEGGLCFGRIDGSPNENVHGSVYIGRIGLSDEDDADGQLLTDWRAPVSRAFYCATGARPEGLTRRRHFHTRDRHVRDFHDEVFDLDTVAAESADGDLGLDPDAALLAALNAPRDGSMHDIVSTIQAEQDEIIRLPNTGVVVIEGGPGTGKTAVAMHRIAYLLYTHRERLARRGVLIVGPNPRFLDYIGQVLPSLGETDVVFATPGRFWPGLQVTVEDVPAATAVKGSARMVDVLRAAVADRQALPEVPIPIQLDDVTVALDRAVASRARRKARAGRMSHNQGRPVFRRAVIDELARRAVQTIGAGWLGGADRSGIAAGLAEDVRAELAGSSQLRAALDRLWPPMTPQRLVGGLLTSHRRLAAAARGVLDDAERDLLYRPRRDAWTVSDAPLLDEAAELLGELPRPDRAAAARARRDADLGYAEGVLQILDTEEDPDGELLRAVDLLDAENLFARHEERDNRDLAERAAEDREWTYGHVVVDEAQELSEMDWRVIMRRCPSRSMTIVGDLAQRRSAAGARSWGAMLEPYVARRWAYRRLTVNYRTPAEIMAVAERVVAEVDPGQPMPVSVRSTGVRPWSHRVAAGDLADAVAGAVSREAGALTEGSVVVIAPDEAAAGDWRDRVNGWPVLTPRDAKGLEFDVVIIVEPGVIHAAGPHGPAELYVALTRATQRLGVLHTAALPAVLADTLSVRPA
jgi:DNA helicase IV